MVAISQNYVKPQKAVDLQPILSIRARKNIGINANENEMIITLLERYMLYYIYTRTHRQSLFRLHVNATHMYSNG